MPLDCIIGSSGQNIGLVEEKALVELYEDKITHTYLVHVLFLCRFIHVSGSHYSFGVIVGPTHKIDVSCLL